MKNVFYRLVLKAIFATIPLLMWYANPSHSQPLSPEDQKNYKECANCLKFQTTLPPNDSLPLPVCNQKLPKEGPWSYNLEPGGMKIEDDVFFECERREDRNLFGLRDVTAEQEESLISLAQEISEDQPFREDKVRLALAEWFAKYYGGKAEKGRKEELEQRLKLLYTKAVKNYIALEKEEGAAIPPKSENGKYEEEGYQNRVNLIAQFLEDERNIFKDFPGARECRYEEPMTAFQLDQGTIVKAVSDFIRGEYIPDDYRRAEEETRKAQKCKPSSEYHAERGSRRGYIKIVPNAPEPKNELPRDGNTREKTIEGPCTIGIETRIFVAEHAPFCRNVFRVFGLYHTSILAGRWMIVRSVVEKIRVDREGGGGKPEMAPVCEKIEKIEKKFYGWYLANGCSGDYNSMCDKKWDELRLVDCKTFLGKESLMESAKYLSGTTQDRFGHRSKSRYGAYPKGLYGFNWLCHQAANAFTSKKWGFSPVVYWPMIFYGFTGNRGISNVKTTCPETHAYLPCVSGAGCCGQCYPALLPPFHGKGYNLKRGWHPAENPKKEWIKTDFMYEIEHINICGWDYVSK